MITGLNRLEEEKKKKETVRQTKNSEQALCAFIAHGSADANTIKSWKQKHLFSSVKQVVCSLYKKVREGSIYSRCSN